MAYEIQILITEKDIEGLAEFKLDETEHYDTFNFIRENIPQHRAWVQVSAFDWNPVNTKENYQTENILAAQLSLKRFRQDWPEETYRLIEVIDEA